MKPGRGITFKLMLVFILFAAILVIGGGTIAYFSGRVQILDNFTNELDIASTEKQAALEAWVSSREADVSAKAHSPALVNAVETMLAANPRSLQALNAQDSVVKELRTRVGPGQPFIRWLILRPADGLVIADTDGSEEGKYREDQPYFIQGKLAPFVQNVYFSLALQAPAMTISAPLISSEGKLIGVLAAHLDLNELNAIIQLRTGRRQTDDTFLVNTSNLFVTQPRLTSDPFVLSKGIHSLDANLCLSGKTGILQTTDYRDVPALIDYAWLPQRNMCLIVKLDQSEVFAPVNALRASILLISGLALLIASLLAYWLARTITIPLRQLMDGVGEIGSGNLNARIDVKNTDEIGLLAQAFVKMKEDLQETLVSRNELIKEVTEREQAEEALRETEERYRLLFNRMQYGFALHEIICNEAGQPVDYRFLEINPAYETLTGLKAKELIGRTVLDVLPRTEAYWIERYGRVAQTGEPVQFSNYAQELGKYYEVTAYCPKPGQFGVIFMDVTERTRAEQALADSELRYRSLFANMLSGYAYCQMLLVDGRPDDFIYLEVNDIFEELTGLKDVAGKKVSTVIPGIQESSPELFQTYGRVAVTGDPEKLEIYIDLLGIWFSISVYSPKRGYFVAIFDNITERKQAEEKLRLENERFLRFTDSNIIGIVIAEADGKVQLANDYYLNILGVTRQDFLDGNVEWRKFTPPEWLPADEKAIAELLKRGICEPYEKEYVRADGTRIPVYIADALLPGPGKQIAAFVLDITERKQAEDELRKSHDELELQVQLRTAALSQANMLLQTLLDNMPDQIYFKDSESRFIKNSKAQVNALGLSDPTLIVGKTDFDFFPHAQSSFEDEQQIIRSGKPKVDYEEFVVWPDGHGTWVSTTKVPLRDPEDMIIGTMGISRDITDRKRNEDAVRNARDELEAFSYSVSHDLRAPLRGIDGWSQALLEDYGDKLDEQGKDFIKRVRSETQHMGSLIDDLLKLSRITRAEMHTESVDLSAIARSIAARLQENEPQRQVEFSIQKGLSVKGDAHLLDIALTNLLDNAFKFTSKLPDAKIEFGQNMIDKQRVFFVRDNGAGFDMAFAKKLFGAFQRMHTASEFPGTGIGLTTVQRIIHRHGGRIWAESVVNEGTTFFFTLEENI